MQIHAVQQRTHYKEIQFVALGNVAENSNDSVGQIVMTEKFQEIFIRRMLSVCMSTQCSQILVRLKKNLLDQKFAFYQA